MFRSNAMVIRHTAAPARERCGDLAQRWAAPRRCHQPACAFLRTHLNWFPGTYGRAEEAAGVVSFVPTGTPANIGRCARRSVGLRDTSFSAHLEAITAAE